MARLELLSSHTQGRGAEVYRAHGTAGDGRSYAYAARRLRGAASKPETFRALVAAQRDLARVSHPNLVRSFGTAMPEGDDDSGDVYVLSELLDSRDLRAVLDHQAWLPIGVAVHVIRQLCSALEHVAHQRSGRTSLCHGAISPDCVLLCANGDVKLADLGVARHLLAPIPTRMGLWHGPLGYASPEQLGTAAVDERSDIYQLGLVFYELLAGAPLFAAPAVAGAVDGPGVDSGDVIVTVEAMLRHEVPSLLRAGVPAALDELVHVVLSKNPQLRPRELGHELEQIMRAANAEAVTPSAISALVSSTPPTSSKRSAPMIPLRVADLRPSGAPLEDAEPMHADTGETVKPKLDTILDDPLTRGASSKEVDPFADDPMNGETARSTRVPDDLRHNDVTSIAEEGDPIVDID